MNRYLDPRPDGKLHEMSVSGLAHVGDAVFELMVRTWLCMNGKTTAKNLHNEAVAIVSAKAQASAAKRLIPELDENELALYKRGRNTHAGPVPRSSSVGEYHSATGIETLFGWLYLNGDKDRLEELFKLITEENQ